MSHAIALARVACSTLILCIAAPRARATQFPFTGTIGVGAIGDPVDVAIYSPDERGGYAFVVGQDFHYVPRLWRFPLTPKGTEIPGVFKSFNIAYVGQGDPTGIAVNDLPEHCNQGQVYVTFPGLIAVFDTNGFLLMTLSWSDGAGGGFTNLTGIDVDNEGNVFVSDHGRDLILKFNAADFGPPFFVDKLLPADLQFDAWPVGKSLDVSVDVCGRIHVTNDCGCYTVSNPDGTLWSSHGQGAVHLPGQQGITALSPLEEAWVTSTDAYHVRWDPVASTFVQDYTVGLSNLTSAWGIEYHKFFSTCGYPGTPQRAWERLYVADRMNACIEVFGEDHLSTPIVRPFGGFWRFDDLQNNCSGTTVLAKNELIGGSAGTIIGAPHPQVAKGVVDHSIQFVGGNGAVQVPGDSTLTMGLNGFTIEGWIRAEYDGGTRIVLDKRVGMGAGYELYLWHGYLGMQLNDGTTFQNCTSLLPQNMLADGEWHHFAVVVDPFLPPGGMIRFYDNGSPTESLPIDGNLVPASIQTTAPLIIGRENPNSSSNGILGNLDDLAIYQSALSAGQISAIYTAYVAGKRL